MALAPIGEEPQPLEPDPGTAGAWNVEADFVASIREGAPVELTSFEDGLRYMQFTDAVWRSWSEGRARSPSTSCSRRGARGRSVITSMATRRTRAAPRR